MQNGSVSRAGEVIDHILNDSGDLITASLYYRFFLHRALKQAGRRDRFFEIIRPWHDKLDEGFTRFQYNPNVPASHD